VNAASLPDQATIAYILRRSGKFWTRWISLRGSEHLRSSAFICGFKHLSVRRTQGLKLVNEFAAGREDFRG
jgi:hypothetical protein